MSPGTSKDASPSRSRVAVSRSAQPLPRLTCRVTSADGFLVVAVTCTTDDALSADAGRAPVCATGGRSEALIFVIAGGPLAAGFPPVVEAPSRVSAQAMPPATRTSASSRINGRRDRWRRRPRRRPASRWLLRGDCVWVMSVILPCPAAHRCQTRTQSTFMSLGSALRLSWGSSQSEVSRLRMRYCGTRDTARLLVQVMSPSMRKT